MTLYPVLLQVEIPDPPPSSGGVAITAPQGRLTLVPGTPTPDADVAGATTIHYAPAIGEAVPIFDGSAFAMRAAAGASLALDPASGHTGYHQAGTIFDVLAFWADDTVKLGTVSWNFGGGSSAVGSSARGTGTGSAELEILAGLPVNKTAVTVRFGSGSGDTVSVPARQGTYLGSFLATADGQATDSREKRLLFNGFNATKRALARLGAMGVNWTQTSDVWRQANNDTANRVEVLCGLAGVEVDLTLLGIAVSNVAPASAPVICHVGIGLNANVPAADSLVGIFPISTTMYGQPTAHYSSNPGLGRHQFNWLEVGTASSAMTWFGKGGTPTVYASGLSGSAVL